MDLLVNQVVVRKNEDGMYCLNDLISVVKKDGNYKPAHFLRNKETKDFIEVLKVRISNFENVVKVSRGRHTGGTWVCKELVYKYAMWISPDFAFDVIRAFDALVMGELATALKIANNSAIINKVGAEFDRLTKDDQAVGEKAMNDFCNASGIYNTYSCKAGEDLASCRGKKKKRSDAEKAITERSQLSLII